MAGLFVVPLPQVSFPILLFFAGVLISNVIIFISLSWLFWFRHHLSWHYLGIRLQLKDVVKGITAGAALGIIALVFSFSATILLKNEIQPQDFSNLLAGTQNWQETFILFLVAVFLSPLWEETFFRGFLYPALRKSVGRQTAVILTGFAFALLHYNSIFFLPFFINGCGLTWLYSRSNSLVSVYVAHAMWNTLIFLEKENELILFAKKITCL